MVHVRLAAAAPVRAATPGILRSKSKSIHVQAWLDTVVVVPTDMPEILSVYIITPLVEYTMEKLIFAVIRNMFNQ